LDAKDRHFAVITHAAERYTQIERICIFGVRVLEKAKLGSDIDLAVITSSVNLKVLASLHDNLDEQIILPYLFNIIHLDMIENKSLREYIVQFGKLIYEKKPCGILHD
jgi:uncharacterized protein